MRARLASSFLAQKGITSVIVFDSNCLCYDRISIIIESWSQNYSMPTMIVNYVKIDDVYVLFLSIFITYD